MLGQAILRLIGINVRENQVREELMQFGPQFRVLVGAQRPVLRQSAEEKYASGSYALAHR